MRPQPILVVGREYIFDTGKRPGRGGWVHVVTYLGNNTFRKVQYRKMPGQPDEPVLEVRLSNVAIRARIKEYKPT